MITAKIIADSISPENKRIITLQLHYPKFIHGEFMTHRVFSRNASSSRAIPFEKMLADIEADMAMPIHWGKNQPGMQAREEVDPYNIPFCEGYWIEAFKRAKHQAKCLYAAGVHKQIVNRLLEPFYNINVLVTATEWDNFFELRLHPDAQPEIYELARVMKEAMDNSTPNKLNYGEWHLPYIDNEALVESAFYMFPDKNITDQDALVKLMIKRSVARLCKSILFNSRRQTINT